MAINEKTAICCLQAFGGAGVSQDTPLAFMMMGLRTHRLTDGPDEVHRRAVARYEYMRRGHSPKL